MKKHVVLALGLSICVQMVAQEIVSPTRVSQFAIEKVYPQEQTLLLEYESFRLSADSGTLKHDLPLQFSVLGRSQLQPMPSNMLNTTGNFAEGYRLLPNGEHFQEPALISIPYDPFKIPMGYKAEDVYSYYYDEASAQWTQMERCAVDTIAHIITSYTTHFTDFANAVIKVPDMPESKAFVPTALTDMPDVNPLQGIPMIAAPTANNRGTAELTYPIELPKGRRGMQPNVDLHYSSAGGNGILGVGWSMQTPAITIDTRWGVPRYSESDETEAYLLNGEQLLLHDSKGESIELAHKSTHFEPRHRRDIRFYARDRRNQDHIIRCGNNPREYHWIVTDRSGTTYYFGYDPFTNSMDENAVLKDANNNIAEWSLTAMVDMYGNYIRYYYTKDSSSTQSYLDTYLDAIEYTGNVHTNITPIYRIDFKYRDNREDVILDGRLGFLRQTTKVLCTIQVSCKDEAIASYVLDYDNCSAQTLNKLRLHAITKYDAFGIQCRHIDIRTPAWRNYDKWASQNTNVNKKEKELFDTCHVQNLNNIPGSRTTFNYCDAQSTPNLFESTPKSYPISNLGQNHNHRFGGGMAFTVGLGGDVSKTNTSLGANFNISYGNGQTQSMMIDINGDGLPDYVYKKGTNIFYKKQNKNGYFSDSIRINLPHLVKEFSLSYSLGFQASIVAQLSATPIAFSHSFTDTYFADVNNDRLPDLITSKGIFINRLDADGNPNFQLIDGDIIESSDKQCNRVVRNGAVDPRLECDLSYVYLRTIPFSDLYSNSYVENNEGQSQEQSSNEQNSEIEVNEISIEKLLDLYHYTNSEYIVDAKRNTTYDKDILISTPIPANEEDLYSAVKNEKRVRYPILEEVLSSYKAPDYKIEATDDGLNIYKLTQECSKSDSLPQVDVVRVWVADKTRTITLNSTIRLLNDSSENREQSRKFDGIKYAIQWCKSVSTNTDGKLTAANNEVLKEGIIENKNDTLARHFAKRISVSKGDILMFRLSAQDNRFFDDTEWLLELTDYNDQKVFKSDEDFYCWAEGDYVTLTHGMVNVEIAAVNNQPQPVTIYLYLNSDMKTSRTIATGSGTITRTFHVDTINNIHDTIRVRIAYQGQEPQWSKINVSTKLTASYHSQEIAGKVVEYQLGSSIEGLSHIFSTDQDSSLYKKYKDLFGVLHKNWG